MRSLLGITLALAAWTLPAATPGDILGGQCPNAGEDKRRAGNEAKMDLYKDLGLGWVRCSGGPAQWWREGAPSTDNWAPTIDYAAAHGFAIYLHIEYRPDIDGGSIYDYDWFETGRSFAAAFGDRIGVYGMINEPDHDHATLAAEDYAICLERYADGVRSVLPTARVCTQLAGTPMNYDKSTTFFQAVKHLINDGTIDVLNLHTYNNYNKIEDTIRGRDWLQFTNHVRWKQEIGITADTWVGSGEWNYRRGDGDVQGTGIWFTVSMWSHLAVLRSSAATEQHRGLFACLYSPTLPESGRFGLAVCARWEVHDDGSYTWEPNARGLALRNTLAVTRGLAIVRADPFTTGVTHLRGADRKGWVWHNHPHHSSIAGAERIRITGLPTDAGRLDIYTWDDAPDSPLASRVLSGASSIVLEDLPAGETVLLVADGSADGGVVGAFAPADGGPTISRGPTTASDPVTGTSVACSVDAVGAGPLTYTWSATGPEPVAFAPNGDPDAAQTTATFAGAGDYTITVTVTDVDGMSVQGSTGVLVEQTAQQMIVRP